MAPKREPLPEEPAPEYKYARRSARERIDYDTIEFICVRVARGNPLRDIANAMCISAATLNEWRRRGEIFNLNGNPEDWEIYGDFVMGLRAASGDYAIKISNRIHRHKDWFRYLKIAERRMPETYSSNPQGGSDDIYEPDEQFL